MLDFLRIPFKIAPVITTIKIANQFLSSLMPSLQILITVSFIDTAIAIFGGSAKMAQIYPSLLLLFSLAFTPLNALLMKKYVVLEFDLKLERECMEAMLEKRASLITSI